MNIDDIIAQLRQLERIATPRPWVKRFSAFDTPSAVQENGFTGILGGKMNADIGLVVEARNALPDLLDYIDELKERIAFLEGEV